MPKIRQVEYGFEALLQPVQTRTAKVVRVPQPVSVERAKAGFAREDAEGNRSAFQRFCQRKRSALWPEQSADASLLKLPHYSQATGASGASRMQVAVVLETVTAMYLAVQQWIVRAATGNGELSGQTAKAFCR
jgi:hypothetical protein